MTARRSNLVAALGPAAASPATATIEMRRFDIAGLLPPEGGRMVAISAVLVPETSPFHATERIEAQRLVSPVGSLNARFSPLGQTVDRVQLRPRDPRRDSHVLRQHLGAPVSKVALHIRILPGP